MCNPALAFAGMQAGGSLMQGYSAMQAGRAQQDVAEGQAAAELDAAAAGADKVRKLTRSTRGAARAALAGSGVMIDSGTALDIDQDIAQRGEEDALMTLLTGQRRARELRYQGQLARAGGRSAMAASVLQAGMQASAGWSNFIGSSTRPPGQPPAPIVERSTYVGGSR